MDLMDPDTFFFKGKFKSNTYADLKISLYGRVQVNLIL